MYQPLFHFRGVAAGAETLRRNWVKFRNKIRLHSATTEGGKNRCGYICLYMYMHVAAQLQAHKQGSAPEYHISKQPTSAAWIYFV